MDNGKKKLYYGIIVVMVVVAVISVIITLAKNSQELQNKIQENQKISNQATTNVIENIAE